jgi:hypothetical protein
MATFLTTAAMEPELAARIEASVRGRKKKPGGAVLQPRLVSFARFGLILLVVAIVCSVVGVRRREREELSGARAELLTRARTQSQSLTEADRTSVARTEAWLVAFSRVFEGELVADELREPGALSATLRRPLVYVRGAIGAFSSSRLIAEASATSQKDAFLACMLDPPASRAEKDLLTKVRLAYAGGAAMEQRTSHARRLYEAEASMPLLTPAWAARVERAEDLVAVAKLRRDFERAPIEAGKRAVRAELLLVAMDEPGEGSGATELDGERAHWVRVGLVDLASGRILVSTRNRVDPSWISLAKRAEYASGLDACALAFDVQEVSAHLRSPGDARDLR